MPTEKAIEISDAKIQFVSLVDKAANKATSTIDTNKYGTATVTVTTAVTPPPTQQNPFKDVSTGDYITREQLAAILYRYEQFSGQTPPNIGQTPTFVDSNSINSYAVGAVNALAGQGIINGRLGNIFDPQNTATRAEFAAMLHRYLAAIK